MDLDSLKKGEFYSDLKESHVIFICMEDVFEKKLPVYTFQYRCDEDNEILLGDKTFKHFFIAPRCAKLLKNEEEKVKFKYQLKTEFRSLWESDWYNTHFTVSFRSSLSDRFHG